MNNLLCFMDKSTFSYFRNKIEKERKNRKFFSMVSKRGKKKRHELQFVTFINLFDIPGNKINLLNGPNVTILQTAISMHGHITIYILTWTKGT